MSITFSKLDRSFSITTENGFEAHFVDREIPMIDLSSQVGCNMGCSMCHLTLNGLTDMTQASQEDIIEQLNLIINSIPESISRNFVNINMMAKGDWTLNPLNGKFERQILEYVKKHFKDARIRISTPGFTVPKTNDPKNTIFYWSLYSLDKEVRKRLLPKALDPKIYYDLLKSYNHTIHFPIIPGENDSLEQIQAISNFLEEGTKINLLDYKTEDCELIENNKEAAYKIFSERHNVKKIQSQGLDIGASCGIFTQTVKKVEYGRL
jgi:adenine C2-methylase RlmN of 23S rRNA A2503 and tRNA A37